MRELLCFFVLLTCGLSAQHLRVLSAKDSSGVPFPTLQVKSAHVNFHKSSDEEGLLFLGHKVIDTVHYHLSVYAFGFSMYHRTLTGAELEKLTVIYMQPSDTKLEEVVITAQYAPVTADQSVQRVKVIDSEKIRQMAAVNLRDVLTNQLNVRLQQDNVLGSSLSLQGISGQNVKILIDGVPVIGRKDGNIDLTQINLNNVERIEFIEGPLSVQYGTNALAGTINIITKKPRSKRITSALSAYYESIGTYNLVGDLSFSKARHSVQVSGGRNYFDGWNSSDRPFEFPKLRTADSSRFSQWKPKEQYFASAAYQYRFKKLDGGLQSAYFDEKITNRGYPRAPYGEDSFDDRYFTKRIDNSVFLKGKLSGRWSVNGLGAYNFYRSVKRTVYKDLTTLEETLSANPSDQDTSRFTQWMSRASFVHAAPGAAVNYELGYDLNYQSATDNRIKDHRRSMGDYAAFVTSEYTIASRLIVKPGLRYAYNSLYRTPLIPSVNAKWNVSSNHTLRASYARGFRAPDIKELYFLFVDINHNIIGNSALKAEQSDNFSMSYNYQRTVKTCNVRFDASLFYNTIFNLITLAQINTVQYSYINIGNYKTQGLQLGSTLDFKRFVLQAGFNYTGRHNDLAESNDLPRFLYSPEAQASLVCKFLKAKASIALFCKYNGRLPGFALVNDEVTNTYISAYQMMDLTLNKYFLKERINLSIGCKNLLDVKNIITSSAATGVHSSSSGNTALSTGRNYFIKLTFNFSKA